MKLPLPKSKKEIFSLLKNSALVAVGTFILTFGVGIFLITFDIVTGGISGFSIVLEKMLSPIPFLAGIEAQTYASILMWVTFVLGIFTLGKSFAVQTLLSTLLYPVFLGLAVALSKSNVMGGFFNLLSDRYAAYGEIALVLAAVFGGAMVGTGCAITFLGGGSTGGTDVIALTLVKHFPKVKSSVILFVIDSAVIVSGMLIINDLVLTLLGIVSAFVSALAVSKIFVGDADALIAHIVSEKCDEINDGIIHRLERTTTVIDCHGGYSGDEKRMLMVTISVKQYAAFMALISSIDKNAFVTLHRAKEINGEGWTYEKHTKPKS